MVVLFSWLLSDPLWPLEKMHSARTCAQQCQMPPFFRFFLFLSNNSRDQLPFQTSWRLKMAVERGGQEESLVLDRTATYVRCCWFGLDPSSAKLQKRAIDDVLSRLTSKQGYFVDRLINLSSFVYL